jgi:hypothetical protein
MYNHLPKEYKEKREDKNIADVCTNNQRRQRIDIHNFSFFYYY